MVVGVSVAVFTAAMLSTVSTGVEKSADAAVGADLLVSAQAITAEQADAIAQTPGVASTAPVYAEVRVSLTFDGERDYLTVIVIDADELRSVQRGVPGAIENLVGDDLETDPVTYAIYADVLAGRIGVDDLSRILALNGVMESDAEGLIGAGRHERSPERLNYRNGYRDRRWGWNQR